jgi:hypothetical protein
MDHLKKGALMTRLFCPLFLLSLLACKVGHSNVTSATLTSDEVARLSTATLSLKRQTSEVLSSAKEVVALKGLEYRRKVEAQLKEFQPKIDELKAKAEDAAGRARTELQEQLVILEGRRADIRKRLEDLTTSSGEAYRDVENGINHAVKDLRDSFDKARTRFR